MGEEEGLIVAFVEVRRRKKEKNENVIEDITSLDPLFLIRPPKIEEKWLKLNEHRWRESGTVEEIEEIIEAAVEAAVEAALKEIEDAEEEKIEEAEENNTIEEAEALEEEEENNTIEEE